MIRLFSIFGLIFCLIGCNKDSPIPDRYTGTANALKNGASWEAVCYVDSIRIHDWSYPPYYILRMEVYEHRGFIRESFGISAFKLNHNTQKILRPYNDNPEGLVAGSYLTIKDDGDVLGDIYDLDTTATKDFIQITDFNERKEEVEGVFNVTFVISRDDGDGPTPPEKLEFTNGKFTAKVDPAWFE
jgi:hypothetical protein